MHGYQNGASAESAVASVLGVAGISASARLSLRTELARTLQKTVTFAALAFLAPTASESPSAERSAG